MQKNRIPFPVLDPHKKIVYRRKTADQETSIIATNLTVNKLLKRNLQKLFSREACCENVWCAFDLFMEKNLDVVGVIITLKKAAGVSFLPFCSVIGCAAIAKYTTTATCMHVSTARKRTTKTGE